MLGCCVAGLCCQEVRSPADDLHCRGGTAARIVRSPRFIPAKVCSQLSFNTSKMRNLELTPKGLTSAERFVKRLVASAELLICHTHDMRISSSRPYPKIGRWTNLFCDGPFHRSGRVTGPQFGTADLAVSGGPTGHWPILASSFQVASLWFFEPSRTSDCMRLLGATVMYAAWVIQLMLEKLDALSQASQSLVLEDS